MEEPFLDEGGTGDEETRLDDVIDQAIVNCKGCGPNLGAARTVTSNPAIGIKARGQAARRLAWVFLLRHYSQ